LSELGIGAVISDTAGRRDALHMRLTTKFLIVRFGGYDGHKSVEERLHLWTERISQLTKNGTPLESFDLLIHTTDSVQTPETCRLFSKLMKETCGLKIKTPKEILSSD
jgi:uncharacterized protein YecE (DUF72 family)